MSQIAQMTPGTGELEVYDDTYAGVTPDMVERAEVLEREILHKNANIQKTYFELGSLLSDFKRERLYLARGYQTFADWADSDDLKGLGKRTAYNLVKIVDELLPIMDRNGLLESGKKIPGISTLYDMLPILNDADAETKIVKAIGAVEGLPTRGAKDAIKEIRGIARDPNEEQLAMFKAYYREQGEYIRIDMWCSTGNDYYQLNERGPLMVRKEHWPRLEQMFRGFVEASST